MKNVGYTLVLMLVGCGSPGGNASQDMMPSLPDGFLQTNCSSSVDCDDSDPCTTDTCSVGTNVCSHAPVDCSAMNDDCHVGACTPGTGACTPEVGNENMACTDTNGDPGTCKTGTCQPAPSCEIVDFPSCGGGETDDTSTHTNTVDTYTCGAGFTGKEVAYNFFPDASAPVTVTLTSTVDLDLLILEGDTCNSAATCTGQSVTVGSGNETVTFTADVNKSYVFVIDSKGASGAFTLDVTCAKLCQTTKTLACNQTITGNTTTAGLSTVNTTACTTDAGIAGDVGPEDIWKIDVASNTDFKIKLTGLSADLDLQAIDSGDSTGSDTDCAGFFAECAQDATKQGFNTGLGDETITFTAAGDESYYVLVDSRTATGGAYQMEVTCPFNCSNSTGSVSCDSPFVSGVNDGPNSTSLADSWACSAGTTGPETIYYFSPDTSGSYTFTLNWTNSTAALDLLLMTGTFDTCDATQACAAPATGTGTTRTITATLDSSKTYYLIVDSKSAVSTPFTVKLTSTVCGVPNCYDSGNRTLSCSYLEESRRTDDAGHFTNLFDAWGPAASQCDTNTTGNEVVYTFDPPANGSYTVNLTGLDTGKNLDLIVTEGVDSLTCDPTATCVAVGKTTGNASESVTFTGKSSKYYFVSVDGVNGDSSAYHIALSGTKTAGGAACTAACSSSGEDLDCTPSGRIHGSTNDNFNATSSVTSWGATTACATGETGPEMAHSFTPTKTGSYTFQLSALTADLDLIVLAAGSSGGCDATQAACLGASTTVGTGNETVTVTLTKGQTYYLIVDGKNGAMSTYTVSITSGC